MNDYIEYYDKNKISPVKQNIDDFNKHINKRIALLRHLGIHPNLIKGKSILEVGSGGGYNSMAIYNLKPSKYTIVEPNITGYNELINNFNKFGFNDNVHFENCLLEDFKNDEKFDIIFCEGLIPGLKDSQAFLNMLVSKLMHNGIVVFTASDEICTFFEIVKRHIANIITKNINNFDDKINILTKIFKKDLDSLSGMTREHYDWCADLMCDAYYQHAFSIKDAIDTLENKHYFMGSSPSILQDVRWYKALPLNSKDYNMPYKSQFNEIKHTLIYSPLKIEKRESEKNDLLSSLCKKHIEIVRSLDKNNNQYSRYDLINIIGKIQANINGLNIHLDKSFEELVEILKFENLTIEDILKLNYLPKCFGKGQIFLSFSRI